MFAGILKEHFQAMKVKCSEQIEIVRGEKKHAVRGKKPRPRKPPAYDPRRYKARVGSYAPVAPIIGYAKKWNAINDNRKAFEKVMTRLVPVKYYSKENLMRIAISRGYGTRVTLAAAVAQELGITIKGAETMLATGRMTWGYLLLIGALLEMTPAEFCDVFLSGYFQEVVDGKYEAVVDDEHKKDLLARPHIPNTVE